MRYTKYGWCILGSIAVGISTAVVNAVIIRNSSGLLGMNVNTLKVESTAWLATVDK